MSEETNAPSYGTPEWWAQQRQSWAQREEEARARGVAGLKDAIPFLTRLGVTMITMTYNGEGDSGDIDDFSISGMETAPKTREALDEALKSFPAETHAAERFATEELINRAFEILPAGFEINEGGYGQVIIDCENNKVRVEHNQRIVETDYSEQEW